MPDPCRQEPRLNHLEGELADTVREIRDEQRRQSRLLETIGSQTARLNHVEADVAKNEKAINSLFERQRLIEEWKNQVVGSFQTMKNIPILCSVISAIAALVALATR